MKPCKLIKRLGRYFSWVVSFTALVVGDARGQGPDPNQPPIVEWETTFGGKGSNFRDYDAYDLDEAPDGRFLLGGHRDGAAWLVLLDAAGKPLWQALPSFSAVKTHSQCVEHVAAVDEKSFLALVSTGSTHALLGGPETLLLLREGPVFLASFDAAGKERWRVRVHDQGAPLGLVESTGGAVYVCVQHDQTAILERISSTGELLWRKELQGVLAATPLAATADGGVAVLLGIKGYVLQACGVPVPAEEPTEIMALRLDERGQEFWRAAYQDYALDKPVLIEAVEGGFLIGGQRNSGELTKSPFGSIDTLLMRISHLGEKLWEGVYGGNGQDTLASLLARRDGSIQIGVVSGSSRSGNRDTSRVGLRDLWVANLDRNGRIFGQVAVGINASSSLDNARLRALGGKSVAVLGVSNGSVYVTGLETGQTQFRPSPVGGSDVLVRCVESAGLAGLAFTSRETEGPISAVSGASAWALKVTKRVGFFPGPPRPSPEVPFVDEKDLPGVTLPGTPLFLHSSYSKDLQLVPAARGNQAYGRIPTLAGIFYTVESSSTMENQKWEPLLSIPGDGNLLVFPLIVDRGEPRRFFRVRISCKP